MWTVAGGPDPDFDDARRVAIAGLLDPPLDRCRVLSATDRLVGLDRLHSSSVGTSLATRAR